MVATRFDLAAGDLPLDERYRETNISTDMNASKVLFNLSDIPMWQVPEDVFSDVVFSRSEALIRMQPHGALGAHLFEMIGRRVDA